MICCNLFMNFQEQKCISIWYENWIKFDFTLKAQLKEAKIVKHRTTLVCNSTCYKIDFGSHLTIEIGVFIC